MHKEYKKLRGLFGAEALQPMTEAIVNQEIFIDESTKASELWDLLQAEGFSAFFLYFHFSYIFLMLHFVYHQGHTM